MRKLKTPPEPPSPSLSLSNIGNGSSPNTLSNRGLSQQAGLIIPFQTASSSSVPRFHPEFRTKFAFSSSPGIKDRVFTLSTAPRKLLCTPPQGKHVREDYLVKKLSAQEVQELVRGERNVPLIIDFYATWCGPCILMAQELEMLAVEYENNAMIVKVDTDDEYEFSRDMQVRGLPTLYFISPDPNKDAIRTEGLIPIQMMRDILDNEM